MQNPQEILLSPEDFGQLPTISDEIVKVIAANRRPTPDQQREIDAVRDALRMRRIQKMRRQRS